MFFDKYYENKSKAVAFKLDKVTKYKEPLSLSDLGINSAPQSFIFITVITRQRNQPCPMMVDFKALMVFPLLASGRMIIYSIFLCT